MSMIAAGVFQYNVSQAYSSVSAALKVGFAQIDTALDYHNQEGVGKAIKDSGVPRDQIFVETKVPGCGMDKTTWNPFTCYTDTKKNLEMDLQLLGLPFVDLVIIHFPPSITFPVRSCSNLTGSCEMIRSQWKAMEEFYKAGKARAIGVSNYCVSSWECIKETQTVMPAINQIEYHVGMGLDPQGLKSYHDAHGIVTQAYSPLGNGDSTLITGDMVTNIGKAHNWSGAQTSMRWLIENGVPLTTKTTKQSHMEEDLAIFADALADEEKSQLDAATQPAGKPSWACSSAEEVVV